MKKAGILYAVAVVLGFAAGSIQTRAQGQTPPDFSKVEIKTTKLANKFYTLEGLGGLKPALCWAQ